MLKTKDGYAKVIGTSYQGSSDYLLLSNGDSKAISSLSVNYANDADKLDGYHENSFLRYRGGTSTDQEATLWSQIGIKKYTGALPDGLTDVYNYGSVISLPCDSSRFEIYASHQSSSGNGLYYRSGWINDKKPWLKFIDSSNIGSQSVNYANSAGNADTVDGQHASAFSYKSWWHWSGQSGQPSWIWGGNSENNYYVYNPSNFRVNYAKSAGSVAWNNVTGRPSTFAPSAHTHKWADITDHITKLSQLTNDTGFVTGSVSGKTITINGSSTTWSDTWRPITDDYELGESDTSLSSLGSLTLYNDLLGTIPNPTDYYWANNKISSTSKINAEVRVKNLGAGCSTTIEDTIMATNWLRAKGSTGIYFQDHGGGLYMSDDTWIRTWNGKALQVDNTIRSTDFNTTYYANNVWTITSAARLENSTTLIYGFGTSSNSINTYLRGTNITLQVKKDTSINYNAFQVTADETRCFNYFNMKDGAEVSAGKFLVKTTDSTSYNSSYINHSLVVSNSSINIVTVNKVQYIDKSISFQFGNGSYTSNVGTATIFIPYGYTAKLIGWDNTTSSNEKIEKVELINGDTLKATLLMGGIAGPANIQIKYLLNPNTSIHNLYNTNVPQLYLANNTAQIQYKDKFLSLTDSGLYINGTIYQQLNGYHQQPIFIASAIYNGTKWEYRGCEHISVGIQCTTMIPNCSINNYLVIPVNVTITEVWFLANQFRIRFNDSTVKYRSIYVYYIGD